MDIGQLDRGNKLAQEIKVAERLLEVCSSNEQAEKILTNFLSKSEWGNVSRDIPKYSGVMLFALKQYLAKEIESLESEFYKL